MQTKYHKDITICESLKYQQFSIICLKVTMLEMGSERQKGAGGMSEVTWHANGQIQDKNPALLES